MRQIFYVNMNTEIAGWIVALGAAYLALGAAFALAFVSIGAARIDEQAGNMPWTARCILLPGAALLWPLMLVKWLTLKVPPIP